MMPMPTRESVTSVQQDFDPESRFAGGFIAGMTTEQWFPDEPMSLTAAFTLTVASHKPFVYWLAFYVVAKLAARLIYSRFWKTSSWDMVCLIHNFASVCVGLYAVAQWELDDVYINGLAHSSCASITNGGALVILLQAVHSMSDFICYFWEMASRFASTLFPRHICVPFPGVKLPLLLS